MSNPFNLTEGDTVYLTRNGVREQALRVTNVQQDDEPLTTPGVVVRTTTITCEPAGPEKGRPSGMPETELEYGCVKCQTWHGESDGTIYTEHLMFQSKHGPRRRLRPAPSPDAQAGEGGNSDQRR